MPVQRRKKSKARRNTRRAHHHLALPTLVACPQCKAMKLPHRVCPHCGYYKGEEVVKIESV